MLLKLKEMLDNHNKIIIARHKNPDLDAYGSQFGLYHALKDYYKDKKVFIVGDENPLNYFGDFDEVSIEDRKTALVFILDTVASQMLREEDYKYYQTLVLVDHHRNDPDIEHDLYIKDTSCSSAAEMVFDILEGLNIPLNLEAAKAIYMGILGDTGRFRYNNTTSKTFLAVSKLMTHGINLQEIHDQIYLETFDDKRLKSIFFNSVKLTSNNVAYRKNTKAFLEEHGLSSNYVSRGLIGQMGGIKEIPIWVNFTFNPDEDNIKCEIRSRNHEVLSVAKKYGGGGHLMACGCSVKTWEETDLILEDLNKLLEE